MKENEILLLRDADERVEAEIYFAGKTQIVRFSHIEQSGMENFAYAIPTTYIYKIYRELEKRRLERKIKS